MGTWLGGIVYDVAPANTRDLSHVYGRAEGPKKKSISTLPLSQHIIRLENRDLTEVPQKILQQEKLQSLVLSNNCFAEIPASVATLRHLTKLDFSNNSIKLVAPEIGNLPHLEEVLLENNCITSLPEALGRIAALKLLNLNGNPLKANDTSGPHLAQIWYGTEEEASAVVPAQELRRQSAAVLQHLRRLLPEDLQVEVAQQVARLRRKEAAKLLDAARTYADASLIAEAVDAARTAGVSAGEVMLAEALLN
ncbi:hypothetical protein CYMTET_42817 [Cymbomonas tetramitiformis]|uniref:Uncharacterized protein n=1 Tax=Cymbomonas tetramitiformis TaxID=36881 RepID=A0AAE0C3I6_9CHLO|nr:hypothetical protein CYMTET_42817 [Cymbomonas tetramitiformis]